MLDITQERPISLQDAAAMVPGTDGHRVNWKTVWRWAQHGLRGIRLETAYIGGRRITTHQAVQRFCDAITRLRMPESVGLVKPMPGTSRKGYAAAMRRLSQVHGAI